MLLTTDNAKDTSPKQLSTLRFNDGARLRSSDFSPENDGYPFCCFCLGATPIGDWCLLLALGSDITPGRTKGTIWGAGKSTWVDRMQCKCLTHSTTLLSNVRVASFLYNMKYTLSSVEIHKIKIKEDGLVNIANQKYVLNC